MTDASNGAGPAEKRGRPSAYTPELASEICRRLGEGESLRAICAGENMPARSTVLRWLTSQEDFRDQYARARDLGYQLLADEIIDISDTPQPGVEVKTKGDGTVETTEGDMLGHRRLRIDTRKWYLSKVLPKVYGEKLTHEAGESMTALAQALMEARKRVAG